MNDTLIESAEIHAEVSGLDIDDLEAVAAFGQDSAEAAESDGVALVQSNVVSMDGQEIPEPLRPFDLRGMSLLDLEELTYAFAKIAGDHEVAMWFVLAYIRDSNLWQANDPDKTWEEYAREWLYEVCQRVGGRQVPYSLRTIQTRLSIHRRLVQQVGADGVKVMSASSDAMAKFTRALGTFDPVTGELLELTPAAQAGLARMYPDLPDNLSRVRQAADDIAAIPVHKDALRFIEDNLIGAPEDKTRVAFQIIMGANGAPYVVAEATEYLAGVVQQVKHYGPTSVWPDGIVESLRRKVGSA